jgi:putative copper resistance protein D
MAWRLFASRPWPQVVRPPAAANKLHFIPAMQRGDRNAVHHLTRSSIVEAFVILLILIASAYLTNSLSPPG